MSPGSACCIRSSNCVTASNLAECSFSVLEELTIATDDEEYCVYFTTRIRVLRKATRPMETRRYATAFINARPGEGNSNRYTKNGGERGTFVVAQKENRWIPVGHIFQAGNLRWRTRYYI